MARGTIYINQSRCKGCGLCVSACPQNVLQIDETTLNAKGYHPAALIDPEQACTGCSVCAVVCPDMTITVYRQPVRRGRSAA